MIYRSKYVVPVKGEIIEDGAVVVREGKIQEVGPFERVNRPDVEGRRDFGSLILLPGLINCHSHLEEGDLRSQLDTQQSFVAWHAKVGKYVAEADIRRRFNAVRLGVRESLYYGTTTIVDTAATGASFLVLREEKIHSYVFMLFSGLVPWQAKAIFRDVEMRMNLLGLVFPDRLIGLSPQAPYSTSLELYRIAMNAAKAKELRFQTHLAENSEEFEMFTSHTGPLYEYTQVQHAMNLDGCEKGSGSFMFKNNLVPVHSLIVHGNYLSPDDLQALARRKASLVHCAQSHRFFGHKDFPFETALARGLNICLGTESLASSQTLNLFDDMNCVKAAHPNLSSRTILEFATVNGAAALGLENSTGALVPGYDADMIGVRIPFQAGENLYDELVQGSPQVEFVMVKGEELII